MAFNWTSDGDDHSRSCTVRWYVRRFVSDRWAYTFDWGDYKATYQGDDVGGYLIPRWKKGGPEQVNVWKEYMTFRLKCSPREVNQKAKEVTINGSKYGLNEINSHAWVQCLAEALGIDKPAFKLKITEVSYST